MKFPILSLLTLATSVLAVPGRSPATQPSTGKPVDWNAVPGILARISPPKFPTRDFPITDFGTVADGRTDATEAIRKAIAACHQAGGGRVVVTGGVFLTGAIHLESNVNLHLAEGATLKFDSDPQKYLPVVHTRFQGTECMNYSPLVYAFEKENIAITGKGTLDGSASPETWWGLLRPKPGSSVSPRASPERLLAFGEQGNQVGERVFGPGHALRPNFIQPFRCCNVLIEGIRVVNSPMWCLNPVFCRNVTVRDVSVVSHGPNNDGCNPDSCEDVLIENCLFDTGDDCIAIKSGKSCATSRSGAWRTRC